MRRKQAWLVIAALLAGGGAAWLAANRTFVPYRTASAPKGLLVGWFFIGSGLGASRVRPDNPQGNVMARTGFAWFAAFLTDAHEPASFPLGAESRTTQRAARTSVRVNQRLFPPKAPVPST